MKKHKKTPTKEDANGKKEEPKTNFEPTGRRFPFLMMQQCLLVMAMQVGTLTTHQGTCHDPNARDQQAAAAGEIS